MEKEVGVGSFFSKMRNWRNGENFTPMVIEVFKDMKLKNKEYMTQMGTKGLLKKGRLEKWMEISPPMIK